MGSVAWLCEESGSLGCVFLVYRLNGGIIFYDCVAGRVLQITEILRAQALLRPLFYAVVSKGKRKGRRI